MTVKRGDTIFVTQAHAAQEVVAIVASVQCPKVRAHVVSSTDPYHLETFDHRAYADDIGYLEVDEPQPTKLRLKLQETAYADAPEEHDETPTDFGLGHEPVLFHEEQESATEEEPASEDEQEEDSPEDEEVADESEEGEGSKAVPEDEPDRQPVRASRRKGSRK